MSIRPCPSCQKEHHKWKDCLGYDYFTPGEIVYCFSQVLWMLSELEFYEENYAWPSDPTPTGYVGMSKPQFKDEAGFTTSVRIFGELKLRLELAGWKSWGDGDTLVSEVRAGLTINELSRAARNVLGYVAGEKRKRQKYGRWLAKKDYERRKRAAKVLFVPISEIPHS